ncbi:Secondary metabolite protein [Streptomyces jumonjinensis]|uniref:Secondary metabolite protein n=1 Tax=Streptomyces jumonjinensis TaxID=1945 RepID=UPI0037A955D7
MTDAAPRGQAEGPSAAISGATFAAKLDHLFKTVHPASRGPFTYAEVAEGIRLANEEAQRQGREAGRNLTASAIQQLRTNANKNPTYPTIKALADFFGVKAGFFFDEADAEADSARIALLAAMRDQGVKKVALRANGLSTESLHMLSTVIEQARRLEGLPGDEEGLDLDN